MGKTTNRHKVHTLHCNPLHVLVNNYLGIHARLLIQQRHVGTLDQLRWITVQYNRRSQTNMTHGTNKYWESLETCWLAPKRTSTPLYQR